jgi:hypothetical protein
LVCGGTCCVVYTFIITWTRLAWQWISTSFNLGNVSNCFPVENIKWIMLKLLARRAHMVWLFIYCNFAW